MPDVRSPPGGSASAVVYPHERTIALDTSRGVHNDTVREEARSAHVDTHTCEVCTSRAPMHSFTHGADFGSFHTTKEHLSRVWLRLHVSPHCAECSYRMRATGSTAERLCLQLRADRKRRERRRAYTRRSKSM